MTFCDIFNESVCNTVNIDCCYFIFFELSPGYSPVSQ